MKQTGVTTDAQGMERPPISAIIAFHNERELLEGCLAQLDFCDEVIALDMASTDGSREVAERHGARVFDRPLEPTADPARVWATRHCRHKWILIVDPDEHYPEELAEALIAAMREHPRAGGFRLPIRFYFKRKALPGTVWGGDHHTKLVLIHRDRGRLLPFCNRIIEVDPPHEVIGLPNTQAKHIRHYWSDSYRDLLRKHVTRYPRCDAERLIAEGRRFTWRKWAAAPLSALKQCLIDRDGWRMGPRGWAISAIFALYHSMIEHWLGVLTREERRLGGERPAIAATPTRQERKAA